MNQDEKLYEYVIPDNLLASKRIAGFRRRNWVEALICAGIIGFIIVQIPFVMRVKCIFLVCLCVPIGLLNLIGIRDQSIFEVIQNLIIGHKNKGNYHLRSVKDEPKEKSRNGKSVGESNDTEIIGSSAADKLFAIIKRKYAQFKK